ncbi:MAG TPA: aspartate kinase [Candidatus Ozemobacteraceae bacterium]|nr:aspartate kinase [Candidatus Ozemobacteraceae bacterium]
MFQPGEILVQKFGGSSMAGPERINRVAERIAEQARAGKRVAVVVSAMGDTTDDLITLLRGISSDPDPRELDQLMATGEIVSCSMAACALQKFGVRAKSYNAFNLRIRTDGRFGSAEIRSFERLPELASFLEPGSVAIVAGFQGINDAGDLVTLGRGGSDITAVALARDLGQKVCEKYTDEDGIYTADPRIIPTARKVWHLNYAEMETLARYGNGILHPRSIAYARESSIRIHVRSSFSREEGSVVGPDGDPAIPVKSMAADRKQSVMMIDGVRGSGDIAGIGTGPDGFSVTAREWRSFDGIRGSLRVGFRTADSFDAIPWLWQEADRRSAEEVRFSARVTFLTLAGTGLVGDDRHAVRLRQRLDEIGIVPHLVEQDGCRMTVVVDSDQAGEAMNRLHDALIGS